MAATTLLAAPASVPGATRGMRLNAAALGAFGPATALVAAAVAILPLLMPAGPGNTGPVDVLIVCAVGLVALRSLGSRTELHLPYWLPVLVLVIAGGAAGLNQGRALTSGTALLQDIMLLLWGGAVASVACEAVTLKHVLRLWVAAAACFAGVLILAVNLGLDGLAGITSSEGGRASLTFGDPNRAGSYFALSFVLMRAAVWPRTRALRWGCGLLLLFAVAFTGSNAALVSVVAACIFGAAVRYWQRHGWVALVAVVGLGTLPVLYLLGSINMTALQERARGGGRILAYSVARSDQGASDRELLLSENLALYRAHDVTGAGPGGTKALLAKEQAAYVKEAHNDYLAALLERGVLGAVGLVLLWAAVLARCAPLCARAPNRHLLAAVPRPELLAGAALAAATFGWFHEALHFRHVWAVLGLVAAASWIATTTPPRQGGTS